jgi:predicted amidohydrolase YtcJ
MTNGRVLNRDDLDASFPENPARVDHVTVHGAVMNSLVLEGYGSSGGAAGGRAGSLVTRR